MRNIFRFVWIDLKSFWSTWLFALLIAASVFCVSMCAYITGEAGGLMKDILIIMMGGNGTTHPYSFLAVIVSLIPLSMILLWYGGYLETELRKRCYFSILRTGNIVVWAISKIVNCIIISILYALILSVIIWLLTGMKPCGESESLFLYSELHYLTSTHMIYFLLFFIVRITTILLIQLFTMLTFANSKLSASSALLYTFCCLAMPRWMIYLPVGSTMLVQGLASGGAYLHLFVASSIYILFFAVAILLVSRKKTFLSKISL